MTIEKFDKLKQELEDAGVKHSVQTGLQEGRQLIEYPSHKPVRSFIFDKQGRKVLENCLDNKGKLSKQSEFNPENGVIKAERIFGNGIRTLSVHYDEDGKAIELTDYSGEKIKTKKLQINLNGVEFDQDSFNDFLQQSREIEGNTPNVNTYRMSGLSLLSKERIDSLLAKDEGREFFKRFNRENGLILSEQNQPCEPPHTKTDIENDLKRICDSMRLRAEARKKRKGQTPQKPQK